MSIFRFKKFEVKQSLSAAKVGTDGVLLGAWTPLPRKAKRILDIGTGTGLVALMMAQRNENAQIEAIEIEPNAQSEARFNFENSPWSNRLQLKEMDFLDFETSDVYDVIVTNPPFYSELFLSENPVRNQARNERSLPFESLIKKGAGLLSEKGFFSLIVPYKEKDRILSLSAAHQLFPFDVVNVRGTVSSPIKRCLMALSKTQVKYQEKNLVIEKERHIYTPDYVSLCKDFYLKM